MECEAIDLLRRYLNPNPSSGFVIAGDVIEFRHEHAFPDLLTQLQLQGFYEELKARTYPQDLEGFDWHAAERLLARWNSWQQDMLLEDLLQFFVGYCQVYERLGTLQASDEGECATVDLFIDKEIQDDLTPSEHHHPQHRPSRLNDSAISYLEAVLHKVVEQVEAAGRSNDAQLQLLSRKESKNKQAIVDLEEKMDRATGDLGELQHDFKVQTGNFTSLKEEMTSISRLCKTGEVPLRIDSAERRLQVLESADITFRIEEAERRLQLLEESQAATSTLVVRLTRDYTNLQHNLEALTAAAVTREDLDQITLDMHQDIESHVARVVGDQQLPNNGERGSPYLPSLADELSAVGMTVPIVECALSQGSPGPVNHDEDSDDQACVDEDHHNQANRDEDNHDEGLLQSQGVHIGMNLVRVEYTTALIRGFVTSEAVMYFHHLLGLLRCISRFRFRAAFGVAVLVLGAFVLQPKQASTSSQIINTPTPMPLGSSPTTPSPSSQAAPFETPTLPLSSPGDGYMLDLDIYGLDIYALD